MLKDEPAYFKLTKSVKWTFLKNRKRYLCSLTFDLVALDSFTYTVYAQIKTKNEIKPKWIVVECSLVPFSEIECLFGPVVYELLKKIGWITRDFKEIKKEIVTVRDSNI